MRVTVAIACYREDHEQVERCIRELDEDTCDRIVLLMDVDDVGPLGSVRTPPFSRGVPLECRYGRYMRERDKRTELLELAGGGGKTYPSTDWVLMLDPDERLVNGGKLREALELAPERLPAFPLIRQELSGSCWVMPCKLVRASVERFEYLDVGARWHGQLWNLDPWELGAAVPIAGWPHLVHFRSARADAARDNFYAETEPYRPEREYRVEVQSVPGAVIVGRC